MEFFGARPEHRIMLLFFAAIVAGTILLALPVSGGKNGQIGLVDALFTATSAVCVTGLTVVDTGSDFSLFGQIVILVLIQLGGLGILTFATLLLVSLGARLSFQNRLGLTQTVSTLSGLRHTFLLKAVIITTFTIELIGAVALFFCFQGDFPIGKAAYLAVFHSIAAFCNAGFSTFSNSMEGYCNSAPVLLTLSFLIVLGGLGFTVITELLDRMRFRKSALSLHTKLCLVTTAALLVCGTAAILISESRSLFHDETFRYSLLNSFFQSVTSRTAGFNSVPQASLTETGIAVTILLMFIGASPGSTGGGVKTTTLAVVFLVMIKRLVGRSTVTAFHRSISTESIVRSLAILLLATLVIVASFILLMFVEEEPVPHTMNKGWFVEVLFDTVSAFGTVGLSLGITPSLNDIGKIILSMVMFIGRVGLLTLAFSLARPHKRGEIVYAEESVTVG
jgi:trk system potassium uptake protein TrkH